MKNQKLEKIQELVKQVRSDMNKLSDIEKHISEGLNEIILQNPRMPLLQLLLSPALLSEPLQF